MHEAANLSATAIESIQLGSSDYVGRTLVSETEIKEESPLTNSVRLMQPLMRFLQLLCENHNSDLQSYLREQGNKTNFDLVSETLKFLDCICGSTTGVLGLLGLYINKNNVNLIKQALETLTEYCQGTELSHLFTKAHTRTYRSLLRKSACNRHARIKRA